MREFKSILIIRRDNIGDMVCTTPLFAALRLKFPSAWIGVLANSYNAPVLEGNPDIDDVYAYLKFKHAREAGTLAALAGRLALLWKLRKKRLDVVVLAAGAGDVRGARLARWIAPRLVMHSGMPSAGGHEVERTFTAARSLAFDGPIPPLRISAGAAALARIRDAIRRYGANGLRPKIGVHISARRPAQRWPAGRFAELVVALAETHRATSLLFWSPGNEDDPKHPGDDGKARAIIDLIGKKAPLIPYPTNTLADLMGGLSECDLVICSDGGAMHLAAGIGKPIVCFFGDSPIERWRPWGVPHAVLQSPSRNVEDISLAQAVDAASALMRR